MLPAAPHVSSCPCGIILKRVPMRSIIPLPRRPSLSSCALSLVQAHRLLARGRAPSGNGSPVSLATACVRMKNVCLGREKGPRHRTMEFQRCNCDWTSKELPRSLTAT